MRLGVKWVHKQAYATQLSNNNPDETTPAGKRQRQEKQTIQPQDNHKLFVSCR